MDEVKEESTEEEQEIMEDTEDGQMKWSKWRRRELLLYMSITIFNCFY